MADTYTIQFRRGMYADFDTSKIRPGEARCDSRQ